MRLNRKQQQRELRLEAVERVPPRKPGRCPRCGQIISGYRISVGR